MTREIKIIILLVLCSKNIFAQSKNIINEDIKSSLCKMVALDKNDTCLLKLPNVDFLDYDVIIDKTGYYLSNVLMITLKLRKEYLCKTTILNNPQNPQVEYVVAVFPSGKIFKLKGFEINEYLYFFLTLRKFSNDLLNKKTFLKEYRVSGVDFRCLDEAFRVLTSSNSISLDRLKLKYKCLKACNDPIILQ